MLAGKLIPIPTQANTAFFQQIKKFKSLVSKATVMSKQAFA
jgi:hypothetical protein